MTTYHIYTVHMSSALNGSSALECLERSNAIEIRNEIMFDYYPSSLLLPLESYHYLLDNSVLSIHDFPLAYHPSPINPVLGLQARIIESYHYLSAIACRVHSVSPQTPPLPAMSKNSIVTSSHTLHNMVW